jgi:hypothetical protein
VDNCWSEIYSLQCKKEALRMRLAYASSTWLEQFRHTGESRLNFQQIEALG